MLISLPNPFLSILLLKWPLAYDLQLCMISKGKKTNGYVHLSITPTPLKILIPSHSPHSEAAVKLVVTLFLNMNKKLSKLDIWRKLPMWKKPKWIKREKN